MDASLSLEAKPFEHDQQYAAALEQLKVPARQANRALLLVGSLVVFLLLQSQRESSLLRVGILVGVIAFHEIGHLAGMLAFGYRDVKMFFIPLLGAAVTGRRPGVEAWKQSVVLMLGPLPGIALGVGIALAIRTGGPSWLRELSSTLIWLNGFNLLPLAALDGGKVLQLTLFARNRSLEVAFLVLAALGLIAYSFLATKNPALWFVSIVLLFTIPIRQKLLRAADALRRQPVAIPEDAGALEGEAGRAVFGAALGIVAESRRTTPRAIANMMEELVQLTSRKLPGVRSSAGLLVAWALGIALAAGGMWLLQHGREAWREVRAPGGGWSIWFPDEPIVHDTFIAPEGKVMYYTSLELLAGANQYLAESYELIAEDSWDLDDSARFYAEALARGGMRASAPKAIDFAGRDAREVMLEQGAQTARCIIVLDGKRKFHLFAGGERVNERADHFLRSFQITAPH